MKEKKALHLLKYVPKNYLSYLVGKAVHLPLPAPLNKLSVKWFAKQYNLNMEEAEHEIEKYNTIGHLFTRRLKEGSREIESDLVHPCDALLLECGRLSEGRLIQAKGKDYRLMDLLRSPEEADKFDNGWFLTYYLCPTDYHRVHSPVSAKITQVNHIPGKLWPVNTWGLHNVENLFAVNERVVMTLDSEAYGLVDVIMVGATNVGKIQLTFDPTVTANQPGARGGVLKTYDPAVPIKVGQELGVFHMGSTVILLFQADAFSEIPLSLKGLGVKWGQDMLKDQ